MKLILNIETHLIIVSKINKEEAHKTPQFYQTCQECLK